MIVTRASVLGPCGGVRRAESLALDAAAAAKGAPVYTLGPLIHNPQAIAELEAAGIHALEEAELDGKLAGATVVLRAHGVPPELRARIEGLGARVVDATCPRVIASQRMARSYAEKGWTVVIAGDRGHGEVVGIAGHVEEGHRGPGPAVLVVCDVGEAARVEAEGPIALVAQTTIRAEEYAAIREALASRFPVLEVIDSICPAAESRRAAIARLAESCEAIVVVGGRASANTARLLAAALSLGLPAWQVETATELPVEVFSFGRVGLGAGASTPEHLVDEVEAALLSGGPPGPGGPRGEHAPPPR